MSINLIITIDTEEDLWDNYKSTKNPVHNVARLPIVQNLFDRYGAVPTYLINWPVVTDKNARQVLYDLVDKGRCEIGTHCHPWNTPPFEEEICAKNSMICNLPSDLIQKKMEMLHETIVNNLKVTPVSFRAGRWGFSPKVARSIFSLGYKVDSSITPFVDWSNYGGPDFREAKTFPYRFDTDNVMRVKEDGALLEIPPTIGFYQKNFRLCGSIRKKILKGYLSRYHLIGLFDRLKILNFRWLSPELSSGSEMIRLSKTFIRTGHKLLNMSFHSTSLMPGKSPFVKSQQQLETFLYNIEIFLKFAVEQGMKFLSLSQAAQQIIGVKTRNF